MKPEERMLISAVRYALDRRTYIVSDTCDFVVRIKDKLSPKCVSIIIRDIEEEIEMCHRRGDLCGDLCDEQDWYRLLRVLKEEVE